MGEDTDVDFTMDFVDPDSMTHSFSWILDGSQVGVSQNLTRYFGYCDAGLHALMVNVTDESNLSDASSWVINITNNNRPPQLTSPIPNQTLRQGERLEDVLDLDSYFMDQDRDVCNGSNRDSLHFNATEHSNVTMSIDASNHTLTLEADASYVGSVSAVVNVTDGYATVSSNTFVINVTANTPPNITAIRPYAGPNGTVADGYINLSDAAGLLNISLDEGDRVNLSVRAEDEENDTLSYRWYDDGSQLGVNRTMSYRFDLGSSGDHVILCNVTDGVAWDTVELNVTVRNVNRPPRYGYLTYNEFSAGSYTQTNGTSLLALARNGSSYYPSGGYRSVPLDFATTRLKPMLGNISWDWDVGDSTVDAMDSAVLSTNLSPQQPISFVRDDDPLTYWQSSGQDDTLTIHLDGVVSLQNLTLTLPSGESTDYEIFMSDGGEYSRYASHLNAAGEITETFNTPVSSLRIELFNEDSNVTVHEITLNSLPGVFIRTRTSPDASDWTSWSGVYENSSIIESNRTPAQRITAGGNSSLWRHRYIQFMVNMTTTDISTTPTLDEVTMTYDIPDCALPEDYNIQDLYALDRYFDDPDNDSLHFSINDISRSGNLGITIDNQTHGLSVNPAADWYGTAVFSITCCDNWTCVESRDITVTLYDTYDPPPPQQQGGSGGSSSTERVIVPKPVPENVTNPEFLQLINPKPVVKATETEVVIPLTLRNKGNETLQGIQLEYGTDENVSVLFDTDYIEALAAQSTEDIVMTVRMTKGQEPFLLNVSATAQRPKLFDATAITITPIPRENLNETVRFVRDLLTSNPECLELNEHLREAQQLIENEEEEEAQSLLKDTVDACRYLISTSREIDEKEPTHEEPENIRSFMSRNRAPLIIIVSILSALMIIAVVLMIAASRYNRPPS